MARVCGHNERDNRASKSLRPLIGEASFIGNVPGLAVARLDKLNTPGTAGTGDCDPAAMRAPTATKRSPSPAAVCSHDFEYPLPHTNSQTTIREKSTIGLEAQQLQSCFYLNANSDRRLPVQRSSKRGGQHAHVQGIIAPIGLD